MRTTSVIGFELLNQTGQVVKREVKFPSLSGKTSIRTRECSCTRSMKSRCSFHPFQGRAPFGPCRENVKRPKRPLSFHPFQGRTLFGHGQNSYRVFSPAYKGFHPFQGRALFGPWGRGAGRPQAKVSIPFREELHSDRLVRPQRSRRRILCFHPFQGRPLFGLQESAIRLCAHTG